MLQLSVPILILVVIIFQILTRKNGQQATLNSAIERIQNIRSNQSHHFETLKSMKEESEKVQVLIQNDEISKLA